MARTAGMVLVLLASASIALGSPLCCLVGHACCGSEATVGPAAGKSGDCCPHCKKEQPTKPAPKPCEKKDCVCKHDTATHAASAAEHAPLVAVMDVPAVALPARAAPGPAATSHNALPPAPAPRSHPLLL